MHFGENAFFFEGEGGGQCGGLRFWSLYFQLCNPTFFACVAEDKVTCLKLLTLLSRYNYYVTLCQVLNCSVEYLMNEA